MIDGSDPFYQANKVAVLEKALEDQKAMNQKLADELTIALDRAADDAKTIAHLRSLLSRKGVEDA